MIVIGYQGIGKSSTCDFHNARDDEFYIDLESGLFKSEDGTRPENWAEIYCRIALSLSDQGYTVFVSSHKEVQDILSAGDEPVVAIYPWLDIRNDWIARLYVRWQETKLKKDEIAYLDAKEHFDEEIMHLHNLQGVMKYEIKSMVYNLHDIVESFRI